MWKIPEEAVECNYTPDILIQEVQVGLWTLRAHQVLGITFERHKLKVSGHRGFVLTPSMILIRGRKIKGRIGATERRDMHTTLDTGT
jgi:hypothetical protein